MTTGLQTPLALALDAVAGKLYWSDNGTDKIQRANLDGTEVEDLVTSGLKESHGLTLGAGLPAPVLKVEGEAATLDLAGRFRDPEGGTLTYTVSSSDEAVATASLMDSELTIMPVAPGRVAVAVTARDEGGLETTLPVAVAVEPETPETSDDGAVTVAPKTPETSGGGGSNTGGGGGTPPPTQNNAPDLVIESPSVSNSSPDAETSFTLSVTVRNSGNGSSATTTLRYYRSTDGSISSSDTQVGTDEVGALTASGTSSEEISLTAPTGAGTYYYGACVDAVSGESATGNNCSSGVQVTVTVEGEGPAPDLVVLGLNVSDSTLETGETFGLFPTVHNQGNGSSSATTLRYYRSTDRSISSSDTQVGTGEVGALTASGTNSEEIEIGLTAPTDAGTYYYGACVDAVSGESATGNNCSSGVQVTVTVEGEGPAPDLIVLGPNVSDSTPKTGGTFWLIVTVHNQGDAQSATTTVRYFRSTDATITTSDMLEGTEAVSPLVRPQSKAATISLTAPATAGTYYYGACVDAVSEESATGNNCSSGVQVTVSAPPPPPPATSPDLVVGSPSVGDNTPDGGGTFTLSATVSNTGDGSAAATTLRYYRSTDATIPMGDTQVGTDDVSALAASGTSSEEISLTAPTDAGTYYYGACVDAVSGESDTGNNCSSGVQVTVSAPPPPPSNSPDLDIHALVVSHSPWVDPEGAFGFSLEVGVQNDGDVTSAATTLRYYRSADATFSADDTEVGTDTVDALAPAVIRNEQIDLTTQPSEGTYYIACVDAVAGESNTQNNCGSIQVGESN